MKTVLITGAGPTGVTGRAIKEYLQDYYEILSPSSRELDLTNDKAVKCYFDNHSIDFVVHCATYRNNGNNTTHMVDEELESNLRMYFSLAAQEDKFRKMVYLGSGAEFDKTRPIINIKEEQFGLHIPQNKYGLGKYIMNQHCRNSKNIYNLRMFGTLNKYERYTKNVVCNLCAKAIMGLPLTLKQDVLFSWIDIQDVAKAIIYLFENTSKRHDYNIAFPNAYKLSEIASMIQNTSYHNCGPLCFEKEGMNKEYTCDTTNWVKEGFNDFIPITKSIESIYEYLFSIKEEINIELIDQRWN